MSSGKRLAWLIVLCLGLGLCSLLSGCGDDDDDNDIDHLDDDADDDADDDTVDDDVVDDDADDDADDDTVGPNAEVEEGKLWLHYGDGDRANLHFHNALDAEPEHPEATFGLVIGHELHTWDLIGIIYDYVLSLEYGGPVGKGDDPDNVLDNFLEQTLQGLIFTTANEQREMAHRCLDNGYEFDQDETETIPFIVHFELLDEVAGHFDDAEAHGFLVPTTFLQGLLENVTAVSLDLDVSMVFTITEIDFGGDLMEAIGQLVDILLAMFTDPQFPDFFTLPEDEVSRFQDAGLHMAESMNELELMFQAIEEETDAQTLDVLGYEDLNSNGQYDEGEPYRMPAIGVFNEQDMAIAAALRFAAGELRDSLWDYTEFDPDPDTVDPFHLSYLNPLLQALGLPPFIPDWPALTIDVGAMYANPGHDELKNTIVTVLRILDLFLP